jgi:hypothetical protein
VPCSRGGGHELDRALEHEEGVHVVGVREQDPDGAPGTIADRLALAGAGKAG